MNETAYERVTRDLQGAGRRVVEKIPGRDAMAQCPAHNDGNPSLHLTAIEGRVLLKCFAGCHQDDVTRSLGITTADLFDDQQGARYRYDDGRTVRRSYDARGKKRFSQSGHRGAPTLYRLERIQRADPDAVIYLAEGEQDVHSLEALGALATTGPQGATNFDKVDVGPLRGRRVIAVVDRDAGGLAWAAQVRSRLVGYAADVEFVEAGDGKDATDHVAAGLGLTDFVQHVPEPEPPAVQADDYAESLNGIDAAQRLLAGEAYVPSDPWEGEGQFPADRDDLPDDLPDDQPEEPVPEPDDDGYDSYRWHGLDASPRALEARAEIEAEMPDVFQSGGTFVLDVPPIPPAVWGDGGSVIWAEGEALMLAAPQGVGKTTVALQVVRARLGLQDKVLGYSVRQTGGKVLYLAMDRPAQMRRAAHRIFTEEDRALLDERLIIWQGPPPFDVAERRDILAVMAKKAGADTIIVDSLKDAAIGLSEDTVGAGYNRARQQALAEGIQLLELHHTVKRGFNGAAPDDIAGVYGSTWLTSGAGSVVSLYGEPGDPVVSWRHLKQPMDEVGPFNVVHDHPAGTSEVEQQADVFAMVRRAGGAGLTATAFAESLFNTVKLTSAQKEKARRRLEKKVTDGYLMRIGGEQGGPPGRYFMIEREGSTGVHD